MSEPNQENLIDLHDESYFAVLIAAAATDGPINEDELGFIHAQASMLDYDISELVEHPPTLENIELNKITKETRALVIRDCISLAYIDGDSNKAEKEFISMVGEKVGLEPSRVEALEQWLKDYWNLMERGAELLSD